MQETNHYRPKNPFRKSPKPERRQDTRVNGSYLDQPGVQVKLLAKYGPLAEGSVCRVLGHGYDWIAVQHRGGRVTVPKNWCGRVFMDA